MDDGGFFATYGLAFVIAGMHLAFGRFVVHAIRRRFVYYGVTDERAIIVSGVLSCEVVSLDIQSFGELAVSERPDGSGNICFRAAKSMNTKTAARLGSSWPGAARYLPPAFEMIDQVRAVYGTILLARRARG